MKTKRLPHFLIALLMLAWANLRAEADWKINFKGDADEVRAWASPKEAGLDFYWSGTRNARHEVEGFGTLEWYKMEKEKRMASLVYTGEMKAGRRHGTGVSLQRSGAKYSGQWADNVKEGKGEYWYVNGDYYVGMFHNDVMHGPGRYVSADGSVFEGNFVADERDGPGVLISPSGHRYESKWVAGKDTNPGGAPAPEKPYLMLGVDVRPYALTGKMLSENAGAGDENYLTYRGRFTGGDFAIEPDWPYWAAWSKGGPVATPNDTYGNFNIGVFPVFLDLRIFNPGREKLTIRTAEVIVAESYADLEPIVRLQDGNSGGGVSCEIVNFTPNRVESCEVAFNILPPTAPPKFDEYQFVEKTEPFIKSTKFSLARAMTAMGMDAAAIAAIEKMPEDNRARTAAKERVRSELSKFPKFLQASEGSFLFAYCLVAGEIRIGWTDHAGAKQTRRVKFQFRKCFAQFGAENAVDGPSSGKYEVMLKTTGKGYIVPFAYQKPIPAGGNDRFTVQVASPVSTYQSFRIRLTASDGREILSPPCRLHFLVPRNYSWKEGHVIEDQ